MNKFKLYCVILCLIFCTPAAGQTHSAEEFIEKVCETLEQHYLDSSIAGKITESLRKNQKSGRYDGLKQERLLDLINVDIHAVHNDKHIQLVSTANSKTLPWPKPFITSVKVLEGNIGYLKLSSFPNPNEEVYDRIASAFRLLSATDGVIIDLRNNGGGHPNVVSRILGYFVEDRMIYDKFYVPSQDKTHKYYTHSKVVGDKLINKPLRVLVNEKTASSAELLAFAVQNLKIGQVVGSGTMGMVNLAEYFPLNKTTYLLASKGEQQNPFNESGLEGRGVTPDLLVDSNFELSRAHVNLIELAHGPEIQDWISRSIADSKTDLAENLIDAYTGQYQQYKISNKGKTLYYHTPTGFTYELQPLSESLFRLKEIHDDRFRLSFETTDGKTVLVKEYFDGTSVKLPKTGK